jgi:hypothetical protein
LRKKLKHNITLCSLLEASEAPANNDAAFAVSPATPANAEADEIKLRTLEEFQNKEFVEKLVKARRMVSDQQLKLKTMRILKVKAQGSIETNIFSVLKKLGLN